MKHINLKPKLRFAYILLFLLPLYVAPALGQNSFTIKNATEIQKISSELSRKQGIINNNSRSIYNNLNLIQKQDSALRAQADSMRSLAKTLENVDNSIMSINSNNKTVEGRTLVNTAYINRFWVLLCAVLVFFMQAGFKALEVGLVRPQHSNGVGMKNLMDWLIVAIGFYLIGFGFMFGETSFGMIGTGLFLPDGDTLLATNPSYGLEFFLYQLAFAATSATIVSGAMAERTALTSYTITALFVSLIVYPIFGHWAWGNVFIEGNETWLTKLGFLDFAGSTVVHSIGAWIALIGMITIGPRTGRFLEDGTVNDAKFRSNALGYSVLGVFILWFGWWGFNGGSALAYGDNVSSIILNTNLAGAFGGVAAFFHAYFTDKSSAFEKLIGGVLGGLVGVTACCNMVSPGDAILIGIVSGFLHNFTYDLLLRFKIDDPVGAVPVHGACGVWGTLAVGFFGDMEIIQGLSGITSRVEQIGVQFLGVAVAAAFALIISMIFFKGLNRILGIRVSPSHERNGYTIMAD